MFEHFLQASYQKANLGDFSAAIDACAAALALNHHSITARKQLAFLYTQTGNFEAAYIEYRCIIKQLDGERDPESWLGRSIAAFNLGKIERAFKCVDKAINLDPNYRQAYRHLAGMQFSVKDYSRALSSYQTAVRLDEACKRQGIKTSNYIVSLANEIALCEQALQKQHETSLNQNLMANPMDKAPQSLDIFFPSETIRIEEVLQDGHFGTALKGTFFGKTVAVKRLHLNDLSVQSLACFKRDAYIIWNLSQRSQYLVKLLGIINASQLGIVTEWMTHNSLYTFLANPHLKLPEPRKLEIALKICLGLREMHAAGIVHLRLSSKKILLTDFLIPKLNDYGFLEARAETVKKIAPKRNTALQGNKNAYTAWMAPELFKGELASSQSDIYSFGVILWELFTGKVPFHLADNQTVMELVLMGEREEIPIELPIEIKELITACWSEKAELRPTLNQLITRLEQLLTRGFYKDTTPIARPQRPVANTNTPKTKATLFQRKTNNNPVKKVGFKDPIEEPQSPPQQTRP